MGSYWFICRETIHKLIRDIWKIPNNSHRYFVEELSGTHLRSALSQRYLTFIHSLIDSKKSCLSSLANKVICDKGSISGQNLNYISNKSGYSIHSLMKTSPKTVSSAMKYFPTPEKDQWKIPFLHELLDIRNGNLHLEINEGNDNFTPEEIQELIHLITTD